MAKITNYSVSINGATYVDVSSQFTVDQYPDLLPDTLAINNSLYNLFNCGIGNRGRIFEPTYGSNWEQFLQEPISLLTANNMWIDMIGAIAKWEPRIQLINSQCSITPDFTIPGYNVIITGVSPFTSQSISVTFAASNSPN